MIFKGFMAGLIATIVLSALMVTKSFMGLMPELDVISMLSQMFNAPGNPMVGWAAHFAIGVLGYGTLIAVTGGPGGNHLMRGLVIGVVGWLVMMVAIMPMAGAGLFGLEIGTMAPVMTLILHLIFGAVLGWVYGNSVRAG